MKKITALVLISILCLICLSSCGIVDVFTSVYDNLYTHGMESITMTEEFTTEFLWGNYDNALTYLHPDSEITQEDLEGMVALIEGKEGINFSAEPVLGSFDFTTTPSVTLNSENSAVEILRVEYGVSYSFTMGEAEIQIFCVVLQDPNGFGILTYNLE